MKKSTHIISWALQLAVAGVLLTTLPAKFGGAPGPIALFTHLGMEPHGRYLTASIELVASILILIPSSAVYGAFLAAGVMAGAVIGHCTKLGFAGHVGDMGHMAIGVFIASIAILFLRRSQLPIISRMLG